VRVRVLIVCGVWSRHEFKEIWQARIQREEEHERGAGDNILVTDGVACVIWSRHPSGKHEVVVGASCKVIGPTQLPVDCTAE
jgi:hypothetical protein